MMSQRDDHYFLPATRVHGTSLVSAFTVIGAGVTLGSNCRIGPYCDLGDWRNAIEDDSRIRLGNAVEIGARVSIIGDVELGDNVRIGNNVTLRGPLQIGDRTEVFDGAVIGAPGQYPGRHSTGGKVAIDADVTIREFVAINQPVDSTLTRVGRHTYVMARSQIDHDCQLGEHVKLATGVTLGGAVRVDDYAYLGMNCVVHQGRHIGAHSMLGMNSAILKSVPPFAVVIGPHFTKINAVGLSRRGFSQEAIDRIDAYYFAKASSDAVAQADTEGHSDLQAIADFHRLNAHKPMLSPSPREPTLDR